MTRKNIVFFFIIFFALFFVWQNGYFSSKHEEVITIVPDAVETKKRPEDPGGIVIPNSDSLVYEKLRQNAAKPRKLNILPEPEEPIYISNLPDNMSEVIFLDSIDKILANIELHEVSDNEGLDNRDQSAEHVALEAKKDQLDDGRNKIIIPGINLEVIKATENRFNGNGVEIAKNEDAGYKIQLSVAYSQNDAIILWEEISKRHSRILANSNSIIRKVTGSNNRIFYLIMAGTYPSLEQAKLVCKKLLAHRQNCIVVK